MSVWVDIHKRSNGDALRKEEDFPFIIDIETSGLPRQVVTSSNPIPEDQIISTFINLLKPRR